jgi:hypothetical protein
MRKHKEVRIKERRIPLQWSKHKNREEAEDDFNAEEEEKGRRGGFHCRGGSIRKPGGSRR